MKVNGNLLAVVGLRREAGSSRLLAGKLGSRAFNGQPPLLASTPSERGQGKTTLSASRRQLARKQEREWVR